MMSPAHSLEAIKPRYTLVLGRTVETSPASPIHSSKSFPLLDILDIEPSNDVSFNTNMRTARKTSTDRPLTHGSLLPDYLQLVRNSVRESLQAALLSRRAILSDINPTMTDEIIDALIAFCNGGKMFRAALVDLGYQVAGGKELDEN